MTDPFGSFEMTVRAKGTPEPPSIDLRISQGQFEDIIGTERLLAERTPLSTRCRSTDKQAWNGSPFTEIEARFGLERWGGATAIPRGCPWNVVSFPLGLSQSQDDRMVAVHYDRLGNLYALAQIGAADGDAAITTAIVKLDHTRKLDPHFGDGGIAMLDRSLASRARFGSLVVDGLGHVVLGGDVVHPDSCDRDLLLVRLRVDGQIDATFGEAGVRSVDLGRGADRDGAFFSDSFAALVADEKGGVLVSANAARDDGHGTDFVVVRLTSEGTLDDGYGTHGIARVRSDFDGRHARAQARHLTVLPGHDGIVVVGSRIPFGGALHPVLFRLDERGKLDGSFGMYGIVMRGPLVEPSEDLHHVLVQPGEAGEGYKLVVVGDGRVRPGKTTDVVSFRMTGRGQLDTSYGNNGLAYVDVAGRSDRARAAVMLADRRILTVGTAQLTAGEDDALLVMFSADGQPDARFSKRGVRLIDLESAADQLLSGSLSPERDLLAMVGSHGGRNATSGVVQEDAVVLMLNVSDEVLSR